MRFAVVNMDGRIVRIGDADEASIAAQAGVGEAAFHLAPEADIRDDTHYLAGSGEWAEYPPSPGPWAVFDYAAEAWTDPRTPEDHAAALEATRAGGIATVNRISGEIRSRFITVIPGQEMLYLLKEREAVDWLAQTAPVLADYPLIAAEIGITAPDAGQVAQVYVNMAAQLRQTAAQLETLRLGSVAAIEGASDMAMIEAALAQFLSVAAP